MRHLGYLAVLAGCAGCALWLEPVLRVNVLRRWRRLLLTILAVVAVFSLWDLAAIAAGHWTFDPEQTTGVRLPGGLPVDEVLFFIVVPVCAICGFEAVRAARGWLAGDEPEPDPKAGPTDSPGSVGSPDSAGSPGSGSAANRLSGGPAADRR